MSLADRTHVARAIEILEADGGQAARPAPEDLAELCARLKAEKEFGYARRLYALAREAPLDDPGLARTLRQQQAVCTYKDSDLASERGLDLALEVLDSDPDDPLLTTRDQETLGIAGAIHKRKWDVDGRRHHLERSLAFYRRGWEEGPEGDLGYTGINAAYVLDLLAGSEEAESAQAGTSAELADERRRQARQIREELIAALTPLYEGSGGASLQGNWWFLVTLAEACFGLERYEEALTWLQRGLAAHPDEWMLEATARQLASLARVQAGPAASASAFAESRAAEVLRAFLGEKADALLTAFAGKVGLALSGGGFRASLFHIGVLAKLAELDVLRHVEVLSCVSGGSIIGAHYYLELRKAIAGTKDADLGREAYIGIVKGVEREFLRGVQTDIRNSVFRSPKLFKMLAVPGYDRSVRIGELYEERLYARVLDGEERAPRLLRDLVMQPADGPDRFHPRRHNWSRRAKVPILVLNATTLNTGHNWQFTASWMGEPPGDIDEEVDGNYRLRRMYLREEAPAPHDATRLGYAVAASACVPGLFRPIVLKDLYPGKVVRLVDGGVRDNQGIFSLLEQDCTITLVSDASGQMGTQDDPSWLPTRVPMRSNSILMAAVRTNLYRELDARRRSSRLRELMYVHLKKDLDAESVGWRERGAPSGPGAGSTTDGDRGTTDYGVPEEVQRRLAGIRTDLDAFSDDEAHALMLSGYLMVEKELPKAVRSLPLSEEGRADWSFLRLEPLLDPAAHGSREYRDLLAELERGQHRMFRALRRWRPREAIREGWRKLRGK